ncbi:MAG: ribose 5-phosphate isomerase B [Clostridia bacterium]|nr:ribose 5-phosphate isomerase B [Clostridia bacterium]
MKIAIASDHGGFEYKEQLIPFLLGLGYEVTDMGCYSSDSIDYSDYAFPLAQAVAEGKVEKGIVICGTGIGVSICANKVKGVRCALCTDPLMAKLTREHNDSNVLALGGRIIGIELAKEIASVWLSTPFSNDARHIRRIDKISEYEK